MFTLYHFCSRTCILIILMTVQQQQSLAAILRSSLTTTAPSSSSSSSSLLSSIASSDDYDDDDLNKLWLDDFETEFNVRIDEGMIMVADSPSLSLSEKAPETDTRDDNDDDDDGAAPLCPPPPSLLPSFSCDVVQCVSDLECKSGTVCCYNGCRFTCMTPVQPLPYIDWKRQPQRRLVSGSSWLVPGTVERNEAEWCSTSSQVFEADEDPLLCPHGFFCLIEDQGNPDEGIPNRGRCVRQMTMTMMSHNDNDNDNDDNTRQKFEEEDEKEEEGADCSIGQTKYPTGSTFEFEEHTCECRLGSVLCFVGRPNSNQTNGSAAAKSEPNRKTPNK